MYARLTATTLGPGQSDDSATVFADLLPTLRSLDGFRGMVVLSELDGQRVVALSFWETADAVEGGASTMDRLRDAETSPRQVESQETTVFRVAGLDLTS
jgi:heme-degrading monooxygenase HmoA